MAVLPFEDHSPNGDQQYLSNGLAEELIHQLSSLGDLEVASRNDAYFFFEQGGSIRSIGKQLGVQAILEGSVLTVGENLRVRVQLVDVESGFNLWSADFNRKLEDIIEIQKEVARSVAGALGVSLGVGDANTFQGAGTSNVEAYLAYMRRDLKRAIELDPDYAAAWGLRGLRIASTMWRRRPEQAPELKREAQRHTARALALNPRAADALAEHATVTYASNAWHEAEVLYAQAMALKDSPYIVNHYANMMMRVGRSTRASALYERVDQLHRTRPLVTDFRVNVYMAREQVDTARSVLAQLRPRFHPHLNFVLELNFGTPDTVQAAINAMPAQGPPYGEFFEPLQSLFGDREKVLDWLGALLEDSAHWWPDKYELIALMAAYYDAPELSWRAFEQELRFTTIRMAALWFPVMAEVRTLPAVKQFLIDANLVDYWREYGWSDFCRPLGDEDFSCDL